MSFEKIERIFKDESACEYHEDVRLLLDVARAGHDVITGATIIFPGTTHEKLQQALTALNEHCEEPK